jgi:Rieske Fe-S protein
MNRKEFVNNTLLGCLSLTGILAISSCKSVAVFSATVTDNEIKVPIANFTNTNFLKLRSSALQYDILLVKISDSNYQAYYMKCTHNDASVMFDGKSFQCPLHGSSFDINGKVQVGPATQNLKSYKTLVNQEIVIVKII